MKVLAGLVLGGSVASRFLVRGAFVISIALISVSALAGPVWGKCLSIIRDAYNANFVVESWTASGASVGVGFRFIHSPLKGSSPLFSSLRGQEGSLRQLFLSQPWPFASGELEIRRRSLQVVTPAAPAKFRHILYFYSSDRKLGQVSIGPGAKFFRLGTIGGWDALMVVEDQFHAGYSAKGSAHTYTYSLLLKGDADVLMVRSIIFQDRFERLAPEWRYNSGENSLYVLDGHNRWIQVDLPRSLE